MMAVPVRARILFLTSLFAVGVQLGAAVVLPAGGIGPTAVPSGPDPPLGVHLSYMDEPTKVTITWHTASESTSRAEWGVGPGPPYDRSAAGFDYSSPEGTFLHVVNLTGLLPSTSYYYRVGDASMGSSFGQATFRTAPPKGGSDTFTFGAAGDWGNTTQTMDTSRSVASRNVNLFLPTGDLYYSPLDSVVQDVYEKFQAFGQSSFVQSGMGDNEQGAPGPRNTSSATHCAFSNLPGNERTYAFTFGNTLFMTVDWGNSTTDQSDGVDGTVQPCAGVEGTTAIRAWVDAELAAANADPEVRWKIVFQHHLCYDTTTAGFGELCPVRAGIDQIEDILTDRGVDLVLMGNDHTYGRTHPVRFETVMQTGTAYDTPGAPIYLVLGTGGESGIGTCRTDPWVAFCRAATFTQGFGWFQVSPTMIKYEFVENTAGVVDSFTLTKTPTNGLAVSADPSSGHVQPGGLTTSTITVLGGPSAGIVSLGIAGCPTGMPCSLSVRDGIPPFTSALSVAPDVSSLDGRYRLTIVASNATTSATAPFDLTIAKRHTQTYQRGDGGPFSETDDAYIDSGFPETPQGTNTKLQVDAFDCLVHAGSVCKALIKFPQALGPEVGQVPLGATIVSATLELNVTNEGPDQDLSQVTEPWDESTVTWNGFSVPGSPETGDFVIRYQATPLGTVLVDVTTATQNWADGNPNEGFLIASPQGNRAEYHSSEAVAVTDRPKLTVTYENLSPMLSPLLYYDMETFTANGRMNDLSGTGHHGAVTGTAPVPGMAGSARHFNAGDRITASAIPVPDANFTVAAWFNWTTNPSPHYSGIHGGDGSWELRILSNGRFGATFYQSTTEWTETISPLAYDDGTWHHAAAVLRAGLVELYVDGVLVAQDTTDAIGSVRTATLTQIGLIASDLVGDIDELRVFSRAVTAREIETLIPSSLILSYDMETLTTDGKLNDFSGSGHHGTMAGTIDVPGKVGRARHFNAGDRITASAIPVPDANFTVAAWFNWTTNPSPHYSGIQGGNGSWELRILSNGRFGATFYQSTTEWTETISPLAYDDGTWHHAAAVLRAGLVELYVDGFLVAQDTTNPLGQNVLSTQTILGQVASDFVGAIDEVRVYSRALSAPEIEALAPPRTDGLVLSYDMESLTGDGKMNDLSGSGRHGTIAGTTDVPGRVGRARHFTAGDRITAPAIQVPAADFTIAAWFNWTTNPSPHYSGIHGGDGSWELRILSNGRFGATFYQSTTEWTETISPLAYDDGTWHHAAAVLRAGLVELYVDGVLVAQDTTDAITSVRTSTGIVAGQIASDFVGDVDEVRIFSRAFTGDEIGTLFSLLLAYDMETLTTDGRLSDSSGHGHHGTMSGTSDVPGKVGQARHFIAGDRIVAPAISVPGRDFTVAAWFNWTTNPSPHYSGVHGGDGSWELRVLSNGRFGATFYQSTTEWTETISPLAYDDGTWHHAAAVLRAGLVELYVDGVLVAQDSSAPITSVRKSTPTVLGQVASNFVGDMDEVRIYSRALSAGEIADLAPPPGEASLFLSGLSHPIALAFAPDGRIFYAEWLTGNIQIIENNETLPTPFYTLANTATGGERGLLGLALDPEFPTMPYVYAYHTYDDSANGTVYNRVVRILADGNTGVSQTVLLRMPPLSAATNHNGGVIAFGPDGMLYAVVGENAIPALSQDPASPMGKVLRMTRDGWAPPGNPFVNDTRWFNLTYTYGHRNMFGLAVHPFTDGIFSTENGPECNDEVNLLAAGENFGWGPNYTCQPPPPPNNTNQDGPNPVLPIWWWDRTICPTNAAVYVGPGFPTWQGDLFMGECNFGRLHRLDLTAPNYDTVESDTVIWTSPDLIFDVELGPDGAIWLTTLSAIYRFWDSAKPPVASFTGHSN